MRTYVHGNDIGDFDAVKLMVADSRDMLDWSHGEVLKPETINYRTQKPERDGLFCERIFGPVKDINPHDAKFKGIRTREAAVDKHGELVTRSIVRRERMGHISLATPVAHIWFLRGTPSAIGQLLGMTVKSLERVAYFASYIVLAVNSDKLSQLLADKIAAYEVNVAAAKTRYEAQAGKGTADSKSLAMQQSRELDELNQDLEAWRKQHDGLKVSALLSETDYRALPDELRSACEVGMGGAAIKKLLDQVNLPSLIKNLAEEAEAAKGQRRKKIMKRLRLLESMERAGIKPSSMCLSVLPVIPPDLRPMVQLTGGRFATSDLNDLYRRVINRNNRLKKLIELNAPEVIRRNEQRMLQEAVDALIDNNSARSGRAVAATGQRRRLKSLSDLLKGKQGRFRQNLLGKRVDYSGRSVIVAGPELSISQCGLPKMMALELFKPFVIGHLISQELAHNIRGASRMIENGETAVWDALDEVIKGKYVLLNRAPTLHRLGIQAFQPVLIEGKAIQLHPLVCKGFNADFDGDQMAVHLPLSERAQAEAREIMAANCNLLKPADGSPILHIEQDIVLGCYYLTYQNTSAQAKQPAFAHIDEALMAYDQGELGLQASITVNFRGQRRATTLGRLLFNELFPDDFPFHNDVMTKRRLNSVMADIYHRYGQQTAAAIADDLKNLGFYYATSSGLSMGMDDFREVEGLAPILAAAETKVAEISNLFDRGFITDSERYRLTVETWQSVDNSVQAALSEQFSQDNSSMAMAVNSGARGNIGQVNQAVGMFGLVGDASGRTIELPIKSNYKTGFTPLEYFTATRGARKGMIDTALKTADSGYLTRRLVDVSQDVFTIEDESEHNDPGFPILRADAEEIGVTLSLRLQGRYAAENVKGYLKRGDHITATLAKAIDDDPSIKQVRVLSPLSATTLRGVPCKSYGIDPATGSLVPPHHPVGVIAAQSIGEPGTQLTLKTFHAGGVAGEDITTGLPRVEELFEVRTPKGQAFLAEIDGVVAIREQADHYLVEITAQEGATLDYPLGEHQPVVKNGQSVSSGDVLASLEDGREPLLAGMDGTVKLGAKTIRLLPAERSRVSYEVPGYKQLSVSNGQKVVVGQRLTNGSINLHDLVRLQGVEATQRYIMNEILRIFATQGQTIADKHLEIIVRQMFSRVQIEEPGDSHFVTGDIVSKLAVQEANEQLQTEGRRPAQYTQLLLGITKASLATDSFLSAASFQDTTRVLIAAATSGKLDKLYGLKENVILGRLIPVGTGCVQTPSNGPDTPVIAEAAVS